MNVAGDHVQGESMQSWFVQQSIYRAVPLSSISFLYSQEEVIQARCTAVRIVVCMSFRKATGELHRKPDFMVKRPPTVAQAASFRDKRL
jgi:hypothetical protein